MYNLIESVIRAGGYKLSEVQHKAKKLYLMGDITEEELDRLLQMASDGVNTDAERPETLEMLRNLSLRISELEARMAANDDPVEPDAPAEYEAWEPWDGLSDKYQKGDRVTHGGKVWESVFDGQNVWEPGTAGTEALWIEYGVEDVT